MKMERREHAPKRWFDVGLLLTVGVIVGGLSISVVDPAPAAAPDALEMDAADTAHVDQTQTDAEIRARVEKRLRLEDEIAWRSLEVDVTDGEVTLNGVVRTRVEKGLATKLAVTVPGVDVIDNRILVNPDLPPLQDKGNVHIERESRDRVLEGHSEASDKQLLP